MAREAADRASSPEIRYYAGHLIEDHDKAHSELMDLASRRGMSVPTAASMSLPPSHYGDVDRDFVSTMIDDHAAAIALFEREALCGGDPEVRAFANRHLPVLHDHLRMAQALQARLSLAWNTPISGMERYRSSDPQ